MQNRSYMDTNRSPNFASNPKEYKDQAVDTCNLMPEPENPSNEV